MTRAIPDRVARGRMLWRLTLTGATLVILVGLLWMKRGRESRPWETPRWDPERFTGIRGVAAATSSGGRRGDLWLVPVNLSCGSCTRRLWQLTRPAVRPPEVTIAALVVDTPERPAPDILERFGVAQVWWDEREIWRSQWGHAFYGEVLIFGHDGTLRRTVAPGRTPEGSAAAGFGVPSDDQ